MRQLSEWTRDDLQAIVDAGEPEGIHREYKASAFLSRDKTPELTKAVTAFANSDGGLLIFGIVESKSKPSVPVRIDDGVGNDGMSRETLDQLLISNISPPVSGLIIREILVAEGRRTFAVEVPRGSPTAPHQASDKRYYRRFNFTSQPMHDSDVRSLMNRRSIPAGKFDELWEFGDDGWAPAKKGQKWGFINSRGDWVIRPISEDIIWPNAFNNKGTTFVKVGGSYRLINREGRFVSSQLYDEARYFKKGLAEVSVKGKWGLIDEQGKQVLAPNFSSFTAFHEEGLAAAFEGKQSWIIDRKGRRQFGTKFDRVGGFFGGGWAAASINGKWGAIDVRGHWLITPKYDCVSICFDEPPPMIQLSPMSED